MTIINETPFVSALDMPDVPMGQLPEHLQLQRDRVICKDDAPIHTESIQYSGAYASMGIDNSSLGSFHENFKIEIKRLTDDEIEFDMVGIDAALANAFRRILIAEVPTMAIEKVYMVNNTSLVPDEMIAHRLGLIPLKADPRLFEYLSENDTPNERNSIVFKLDVKCGKDGPRMSVKSSELKWLPEGGESLGYDPSERKKFTAFTCSQDSLLEFSESPLAPAYDDITIARLGPSQEIKLEAHAVKGVGKVHAKWSPVATAWYRMLPEVVLLKDVRDDEATKLVETCPVKVFDIEDLEKGAKKAVVANPRACTLCRECIHGAYKELVEVRRVRDHFIFTIESTGALPPEVLFTEAAKILEDKCDRVMSELS